MYINWKSHPQKCFFWILNWNSPKHGFSDHPLIAKVGVGRREAQRVLVLKRHILYMIIYNICTCIIWLYIYMVPPGGGLAYYTCRYIIYTFFRFNSVESGCFGKKSVWKKVFARSDEAGYRAALREGSRNLDQLLAESRGVWWSVERWKLMLKKFADRV